MSPSIRTAVLATLALLAPAATARAQTIWDLYYESAAVAAPDGAADDWFGTAVSLSGDTLVVGAPFDDVGLNGSQGTVRIYVRSGDSWVLQQVLTPADGEVGDWFGYSVALSGDTLAVGVPDDDVGVNAIQGSVRVYTRSGGMWTPQATLTTPDGQANDRLGRSVSLSGDTLVASAWYDTVGANALQGSVRVFTRSGAVWTHQQVLTAPDGAESDFFGNSVSLSGDTLAVGVQWDDVGTKTDQGSVLLFIRSGTVWSVQQTLTASNGALGDQFGFSVALSGDTLAVGAPTDDIGSNQNAGSVNVFTRNGTIWTERSTLAAADGMQYDFFGGAVSLSADTLAVGAPYDRCCGPATPGSVRVFVRDGNAWIPTRTFTAADGAAGDGFGSAVSIVDSTLVVGAPYDNVGSFVDQGSVRIFNASRALNATTSLLYPSLASAIAGSAAGDRLVVGSRAFSEATGIIDASQKRFTFTAVEPLVLAEGALLNLANDTVFEKSLDVDAGGLTIAGKLQAPVGGNLVFAQLAVTNEGQFSQRGASIAVNQGLSSESGGVCYLKGSVLAETVSTAVGGQNRVAGDTDVFADYTNAGATIIQRGILYIYGSLVNTGTITGQFNNGFLPPEPGDGYSVSGDYIMSADASVILSDPVWWLRTSGNFDVAINDASRFDFGQATLELASDNPKAPQSAKVLSRDLGAADAGFATTNFPLGSLRLRAGANAELVDSHNNAPGKQAEAIYTQELVVPAGATLVTNGLKVYTRVATIAGTVSSPSDIVVVPGTPPCVADIVADGVVNGADLALVLTNWGPCATSTCVADIDRNGTVDAADLSAVLVGWGGCAD